MEIRMEIRILTKVGWVTVSPEESKRLDEIAKKENKTPSELINLFL